VGAQWTAADIPDQRGRVAIVTGASSGIGGAMASALAARGAHVVLAVRNLRKGEHAAARIVAGTPRAVVTVQELDLASLASTRRAVDQLREDHPRIDLLINNAGVMNTRREVTEDGFEMQLGTNHLGHFALTLPLLENMLPVDGSRVVTVGSLGDRPGRIHFDDLHFQVEFAGLAAYHQSKLANVLFTYELNRRLAARGADTIAVVAHPGFCNTAIMRDMPGWMRWPASAFGGLIAHGAATGALPPLRAATGHGVRGGDYYGPGGFLQCFGHPRRVHPRANARDQDVQRRLWAISETLTGVTSPV
jgi:NAD(P)-dependent dehydrogenase (short-subunit alcohol dehydrogenase family)